MHKNSKGFGIIEVLVSVAISLILMQAMSSIMINSFREQQKLNSKLQFTTVKESVLGYLSNQSSWEKTVSNNTSVTQCLLAHDCTSGAAGVIDLYDITGAKIIHSNDPKSGFTAEGVQCNSFDENSYNDCVYHIEISWTAQCPSTAPCDLPEELVTSTVKFNRKFSSLNPKNYSFEKIARRSLSSETPVVRCANAGKIFIGNSTPTFNGEIVDGAGCVNRQAFMGPQGVPGPGTTVSSLSSLRSPGYVSLSNINPTSSTCGPGCQYLAKNPDVAKAYASSPGYIQDAANLYGVPTNQVTLDQMAGAHYFQMGSSELRNGAEGLVAPPADSAPPVPQ